MPPRDGTRGPSCQCAEPVDNRGLDGAVESRWDGALQPEVVVSLPAAQQPAALDYEFDEEVRFRIHRRTEAMSRLPHTLAPARP